MIVELSRRALRDLDEIGTWIARDDPDTADQFLDRLNDACLEIADRPTLYPLLGGSRTIRRRLFARRYLILFRVRGDVVKIVAIRHGARKPLG